MEKDLQNEFISESKYEGVVLQPSIASFDMNIFADLNDEDFATTVENIAADRKHMLLENRIFESFLRTNEPSTLSGLANVIAAINEIEKTQPLQPPGFERLEGTPSPKTLMLPDRTRRINISLRCDLIAREVEQFQENLDQFTDEVRRIKARLVAEIEESSIRMQEVKDSRDLFEQSIVIEGVDPITQRIPCEKFIWFMQDWHKSKVLLTEKLRLRNCAMSVNYRKLKMILLQKIDLGESIHSVDYEQLLIENRCYLAKIEQKNTHLIELKKMMGKALLILTSHKNYLHEIMGLLKRMKISIEEVHSRIDRHIRDCWIARKEFADAKNQYNIMKELIENYKVPEIMDYVKTEAELSDLHKAIKIQKRKEHISTIIFHSNVKMMKMLTGSKKAQSWWFTKQTNEPDVEQLEEDDKYIKNLQPETGYTSSYDIFTKMAMWAKVHDGYLFLQVLQIIVASPSQYYVYEHLTDS